MRLTVDDLGKVTHHEFRNRDLLKGKKLSGVSTDTRTLKPGDLFIALRGEHFEGHKFIADAFDRGAVSAVAGRDADLVRISNVPILVVEDTTKALGELANLYRRKFSIPVIAIGGSNGKTTTKDMVASVLRMSYKVLATEGNNNNQIGVPLTLFRLESKHRVAVVEIGTNHPGEIEYLCRILEPTEGLITNIGHEHLEFFNTLEGVAAEEGRLFRSLKRRKRSRVFVNANDVHVNMLSKGMLNRYTYGLGSRNANVIGRIINEDGTGCVRFEFRGKQMKRATNTHLRIPGRHNAANALAAAAVGLAHKVPSVRIRKALESFRATSNRMEVLSIGGATIYNDTYNANPDSMSEALRTLSAARVSGKKIAVLADMRELGLAGPEEHARIGRELSGFDVDILLTFGELARHIHDAAKIPSAIHYEQQNVLAEYLAELLAPGDAVLVKGSRGMKMEDVVTFLAERMRHTEVSVG